MTADIIEVEIKGEKKQGVFVQTNDNLDIEIVKWGLNCVLEERQKFVDSLRQAKADGHEIIIADAVNTDINGKN